MTRPVTASAGPPTGGRDWTPSSTYRLQCHGGFDFAAAAAAVPALQALGVGALYLSPVLTASPGSTHGYDVVDPGAVSAELGGERGLRDLAAAAHAAGMGVIADLVPNHMAVGDAAANAWWADVLRHGRQSPHAAVFDVDWDAGPLLLPVLPADDPLADVRLRWGPEVRWAAEEWVLHSPAGSWPCAPGTVADRPAGDIGEAAERAAVLAVHARQHYRLVAWTRGAAELTYRRFFDVTSLAGVRVEDEAVFRATHRTVLRLISDGVLDGLRIDHVDGLADPTGYLHRLAGATGGAYTVVEKILAADEPLPPWPVAGTSGYDALALVERLCTDPDGLATLWEGWRRLPGAPTDPGAARFADDGAAAVRRGKREALTALAAEVARLARLGADPAAVSALLVHYPVYRSYLPAAGADALQTAVRRAEQAEPPAVAAAVAALATRLADPTDSVAVRFAQTSGMVMAKGAEDTAFYRLTALGSVAEVGMDLAHPTLDVAAAHRALCARERDAPRALTARSTHDTKRSEDVRARLSLLADDAPAALDHLATLDRALLAASRHELDAPTRWWLHQAVLGAWPLSEQRLADYLAKSTREAKLHTGWTVPDADYDAVVAAAAHTASADPAYRAAALAAVTALQPGWERSVLARTALGLTMPGVPDTYQGGERLLLTLVDPDNRAVVVPDAAPAALPPGPDATPESAQRERQRVLGERKRDLTVAVLRDRRDTPQRWRGYQPLDTGDDVLFGFVRGGGVDEQPLPLEAVTAATPGLLEPTATVAVLVHRRPGRPAAADGGAAAAALPGAGGVAGGVPGVAGGVAGGEGQAQDGDGPAAARAVAAGGWRDLVTGHALAADPARWRAAARAAGALVAVRDAPADHPRADPRPVAAAVDMRGRR